MAHLGTMGDLPAADMERVERKVLTSVTGEDSTLTANVCLLLGIAICVKGGATKEQITAAFRGMLDAFHPERSH